MKIVHQILLHMTNVLAICFITYYILDIYNPMMKFIDNDVSKLLLLIFGITALIGNQITMWQLLKPVEAGAEKPGDRKRKKRAEETFVEEQIEEL